MRAIIMILSRIWRLQGVLVVVGVAVWLHLIL
jgi:hypothetical protein